MLDCLNDLHVFLLKHNVVRPVVLMMDGHLGHYGLEIADYCQQKEIQIWLFSAHMTHHLQPLDLVMFAPVKREMQQLSQAWMAEHPGQTLTKYTMITEAAYPAMEKVCTPELIRKSWEVSGVFPWNEERPRKNGKFGPSEIFEDSTPTLHQTEDTDQPLTPEQPPAPEQPLVPVQPLAQDQPLEEMPLLIQNEDDDGDGVTPTSSLTVTASQLEAEDGGREVGHEHHEAEDKEVDSAVSEFVLAHERQLSLQQFIIDEIRGKHGVDITPLDQAMSRVRAEAEIARGQLNMREEVEISIPFLTVKQGSYIGFSMKLTRDKFVEIHREQQRQASVVGQSGAEAGERTERRDRSDTGIAEAVARYSANNNTRLAIDRDKHWT